MATVLMLGRPPPLKLYRQPVSANARALVAPAPRRRIEHHRRVHRTDRELKTRRALRKVDAGAGRHRTNVQLGAAARDHLALPPPLRLQHARPAPRQAIIERVLTLHEPPDPHTIRAGPPAGGRTMPSPAHNIRTAGTSERKFFSGSAHTVVSPTTSAAPAPQLNGPA